MTKHKCTLFVKNMDIMGRVGIFDAERKRRTRLSITLEVECKRVPGRGKKETIADLISYADIAACIRDTVESGHFDLIETLADAILDRMQKDKRALYMRVTINKIGAYTIRKGLLDGVDSIGVVMERWK